MGAGLVTTFNPKSQHPHRYASQLLVTTLYPKSQHPHKYAHIALDWVESNMLEYHRECSARSTKTEKTQANRKHMLNANPEQYACIFVTTCDYVLIRV